MPKRDLVIPNNFNIQRVTWSSIVCTRQRNSPADFSKNLSQISIIGMIIGHFVCALCVGLFLMHSCVYFLFTRREKLSVLDRIDLEMNFTPADDLSSPRSRIWTSRSSSAYLLCRKNEISKKSIFKIVYSKSRLFV